MTTATRSRSDVHRPSALDPADYLAVGSFDAHESEGYSYLDPEYADADLARPDNLGRCDHCGHSIRYGEIFAHVPTGELVNVGLTCATKLGMPDRDTLADREDHRRRIMAAERGQRLSGDPAARQAIDFAVEVVEFGEGMRSGRGTAVATVDGETVLDYEEIDRQVSIAAQIDGEVYGGPLSTEIEKAYCAGLKADAREYDEALGLAGLSDFAMDFARSVWRRFERDATLSDKQVAVLLKLKGERTERIEQTTARITERELSSPVPETDERITIEGEIVSVKFRDDDFGGSWKMVVKHADGWKVWGSRPDSISDAQEGDKVRFVARVSRSDDDETFGFFNRPTKAEITEAAPESDEREVEEEPATPSRTAYWLTLGGKIHKRTGTEEEAEQELSRLIDPLQTDVQIGALISAAEIQAIAVPA